MQLNSKTTGGEINREAETEEEGHNGPIKNNKGNYKDKLKLNYINIHIQ